MIVENFGAWSLVPPLLVVVVAVFTRRSIEPLIVGCVVGYLMIGYGNFPANILKSLIKTMQQEDLVWIILVCSLYGGLIHLMLQSGAVQAFGAYVLKRIKTKKSALLASWTMGILIFIDDYLNALIVGSTMRKVTDNFKIPREKLAFVVGSTAAPICVLAPISTWSVYITKLMEKENVTVAGSSFLAFVKTIPYNFYPWFAIAVVFCFVMGWLPDFRGMKKAQNRVDTKGEMSPPGSDALSQPVIIDGDTSKVKPIHFLLPVAVLIASTVSLGVDALKGVVTALAFTIAYYAYKKIMPLGKLFDGLTEGAKSMTFVLVVLVFSYVLKNVGDDMGLTAYVISSLEPVVAKEYLAVTIFVSLGAIAFATGSSWGVYAIAIPLVIPLAHALDANTWLVISAVISAGVLGAHACFYSDATILASTGTECNNLAHAFTQFPYALISSVLAAVCFLIFGFYLS